MQIVIGEKIREAVNSVDDLFSLTKFLKKNLKSIPLDEKEKEIRWKRNSEEILKDGYVYNGKSCTDICIVAIAILKAKGIDSELVKVVSKKRNALHNMVFVNNLYFDVWAGVFFDEDGFKLNDWVCVERGLDGWRLGLRSFEDERKDMIKYLKS